MTRPGMVKESELTDCVLDSVKAHISNVASLEALIAQLDPDRVGRELASSLEAQLAENDRRLRKIHEYKAGLYERMMDGTLSKEEHRTHKDSYAVDTAALTAANDKLRQEISDIMSCKHERMVWTEHFKRFENLASIDRKTVIQLIHSIKVLSKTELEITFNYQSEYEKALAVLAKEAA